MSEKELRDGYSIDIGHGIRVLKGSREREQGSIVKFARFCVKIIPRDVGVFWACTAHVALPTP
jgi:hypothetical protein